VTDASGQAPPKTLPTPIDSADRAILDVVARAGRISNAQLAEQVGMAPSTIHQRLRSLLERRVVTGFHASIDQRSLGLGLQAMIGVTLRPGARQESIQAFAEEVRALPQVLQLFFLGGVDDFMVHVAVADSSGLRQFVVDHLSAQPSVASTRTSIIFDYHRNAVAASFR
jgi:DNA-binding Lrp family transcriptional regulator